MLMANSTDGDLRSHISGYFDTAVGAKVSLRGANGFGPIKFSFLLSCLSQNPVSLNQLFDLTSGMCVASHAKQIPDIRFTPRANAGSKHKPSLMF